jgi:vacuolar-type H+-ATPase subunit E/Vma4
MSEVEQKLEAHLMSDGHRLDRIEAKIDKLSETVISLARAEEKLVSLENDKKILMERMVRHEEKLDVVEKKVDETSITVTVINRLFWIVIMAVSTGLAGMFFIK